MRGSNISRVLLRKVTLATAGTYRCEVTSKKDKGGFDVQIRQAKMVVLGE